MKKLMTIALLFCSILASAQLPINPSLPDTGLHVALNLNPFNRGSSNILTLPQHSIKPTDTAGTVIFTKLTNTTNHSITLHPLLTPYQATDSQSLVRGILSQVKPSDDRDSVRMQLIQLVGHYIKSPNKESFLPNFRENNNDTLINREYSLIGSDFSLPSWHCGNFCNEAIYLLEATKLFADSDFIIQFCSIHQTMQVRLINGDTVFVDMAVGTPVFMVLNPAKRCGWASLSDILNDTNLVNEQSQYYYVNAQGDSINLSSARTIDNYKAVFGLTWVLNLYHASTYTLDNFSGDFILAAGQSIEYRDTIGYIIDTTINGIGGMIDSDMKTVANYGVFGKINNDPNELDSALYYLYLPYSTLLNISISEAASLFNTNKILLYSGSDNWTPSYLPQASVLFSSIPASTDTLFYGVQTSAPLLITGCSYNSNGITTDSFGVSFYGSSIFSQASQISNNQFNYANGVGIYSRILPNTAVHQTLLYNYNVFNFYKGGAMFSVSDTGILIESSSDVVQQQTNAYRIAPLNALEESISELLTNDSNAVYSRSLMASIDTVSDSGVSVISNIYPNPAAGSFHVYTNRLYLTVSLFDITGKLVKSATLTSDDTTIDVENLINGIYIVSINDGNNILAEKKIAILNNK